MRNLFENQFARLYSSLEDQRTVTIYYELAPTGLVHLGILRLLLRIRDLKKYFNSHGKNVESVLRINDRYVSKNNKNLQDPSRYNGVQLRNVPSPVTNFSSLLDWSLKDIYHIIKLYDIGFDKIISIDSMYKSREFQKLIWNSIEYYTELKSIIGKSINTPPQLLYPLCSKCLQMYNTKVINDHSVYSYHCTYCNNKEEIGPDLNGGLISFKWETSLTWKYLNVSIDAHGLNHINAANVSKELYEHIFNTEGPNFFTVNLAMGDDHNVMRKSQANFVSISRLTQQYGIDYIIEKLAKVKDKTLIPANWISINDNPSRHEQPL